MADQEEGSLLLKRVRTIRADDAIQKQKALEEAIPSPPGTSMYELDDVAPHVVSVIEQTLLGALEKDPTIRSISICLAEKTHTVGSILYALPTSTWCGEENVWWVAICQWATGHLPKDYVQGRRYDTLTDECFKHVRNIWNAAHPEFRSTLARTGCLEINIP
jgi:hypothetical protein